MWVDFWLGFGFRWGVDTKTLQGPRGTYGLMINLYNVRVKNDDVTRPLCDLKGRQGWRSECVKRQTHSSNGFYGHHLRILFKAWFQPFCTQEPP